MRDDEVIAETSPDKSEKYSDNVERDLRLR